MGWLALMGCAPTEQADAAPEFAPLEEPAETTGEETPAPVVDCNTLGDDMPAGRIARPAVFWAEELILRTALERAVVRLHRATGLDLSVAPGGVEAIWNELEAPAIGMALADHIEVDPDVPTDSRETVMLHEVSHMLGARHLGPWEGVMSRCRGMDITSLTDADLEQICSAAPCTTFRPETR